MNQKIEYLRYLHQFLLDKGDYRATILRDWLYQNSNDYDTIMRARIDKTFQVYSESYPDILSYKQWIRNSKIDKLLD